MKLKFLAGIALLSSFSTQAAWWIEPTDLPLRADIQLLADTGIILQPVTTFPLMWSGIKSDLDNAVDSPMTVHQKDAFHRVMRAYNKDHQTVSLGVSLSGANELWHR